jgi:hypothetical protein
MTREISVAVLGGADLDDAVLSTADGGRLLPLGLAEVLRDRHPDLEVEVVRHAGRDVWSLAADLDSLRRQIQGVDVVLRSIQPDVASGVSGPELVRLFTEAMAQVIAACKDEGCRVIVLNGSTLDPSDVLSCYANVGETGPLTVHRLDLELIELSMLDGISVVDVDRVVAEYGGCEHVHGPFDYSVEVCEAIRDEIALVLDEYGFFDDRPLLAQRGRREA